jgi:hypothetical protein
MKYRRQVIFSFLLISASGVGGAKLAQSSGGGNPSPLLQIDLHSMGYSPPSVQITEKEFFAEPTRAYDDHQSRMTFIDRRNLAIYFSDAVEEGAAKKSAPEAVRSMQVFFIDGESGALISRKIWPTKKRSWFNERYDTQARLLEVEGGFLVHAGNSLALYSSDLRKLREMSLDASDQWAATVVPMGRTFFLERIDPAVQQKAEGAWMASDTFERLRSLEVYPGSVVSVSKDTTATKGVQCLDSHRVGESPSHLCCGDPCGYGLPLFVAEDEVVSSYSYGFRVLSTTGEVLWRRDATNPRVHLIDDCERSMDGNRFLIRASWDKRVVFDQTSIPKGVDAIIVYDRAERRQVFSVILKSADVAGLALSPDGQILAALSGTTLRLYRLPE